MTVIVFKDGVLAADKRGLSGGVSFPITKIRKIQRVESSVLKTYLVGFSGRLSIGEQFFKWFKDGGDLSSPLIDLTDQDKGGLAMTVDEDYVINIYDHCSLPYRIDSNEYAIGAGNEMAFVALELGCDAVKTVEVISKLSPYCGVGIDVLTFDNQEKSNG